VASLGIDIGTQSTKAVLAAADGTILAECAVSHGVDMPAPGFAEQDADQVWWGDVVSLCRQARSPPWRAARRSARWRLARWR
jgi:xylulokinase